MLEKLLLAASITFLVNFLFGVTAPSNTNRNTGLFSNNAPALTSGQGAQDFNTVAWKTNP
jgi:hypothetical protein